VADHDTEPSTELPPSGDRGLGDGNGHGAGRGMLHTPDSSGGERRSGFADGGANAADERPGDTGEPEQPTGNQWLRLALLGLALVLLTRLAGWWGLLVFVGIVLMIFLHELGHFVMAKRSGMKVTEFFIGFGPRIWSFRRGETEYGIKVIPALAYVKIIGMNNLEEIAPEDEPRTYRQKSFGDRLGVAVAGSAMHFIQALVLIFILLVFIGGPGGGFFTHHRGTPRWPVESVELHSPAERAGLKADDQIIAVDGHTVAGQDDFQQLIGNRPNQPVSVTVLRDGQRLTLHATIGEEPNHPHRGRLGFQYNASPTYPTEKVGVVAAIPQTFREFGAVTTASVKGFGSFVSPSGLRNFGHQLANDGKSSQPNSGSANQQPSSSQSTASSSSSSSNNSDRVMSIVGVFRLTTSAAQQDGISAVLLLFVLINVFIGLFNLIPLLPFDGGHVVIAVYEKVQEVRYNRRRYFADVTRMLPLTYFVVLLLAGLFVTTLYLDITSPILVK
jgi:membrane-associated protease RseP (regulator of RpoE activity)